MNKTKRIALARRITEIAEAHGATETTIRDEPQSRYTWIRCKFPTVSISMDIGFMANERGISANWYDAKHNLRATQAVDSVNACHRGKASMYAPDIERFVERFTLGCRLIQSGEAFE